MSTEGVTESKRKLKIHFRSCRTFSRPMVAASRGIDGGLETPLPNSFKNKLGKCLRGDLDTDDQTLEGAEVEELLMLFFGTTLSWGIRKYTSFSNKTQTPNKNPGRKGEWRGRGWWGERRVGRARQGKHKVLLNCNWWETHEQSLDWLCTIQKRICLFFHSHFFQIWTKC